MRLLEKQARKVFCMVRTWKHSGEDGMKLKVEEEIEKLKEMFGGI